MGATSVACSLAVELRRQTSAATVLLDLDIDSGLAGFLMNLESKTSILDAAKNLHHLDVQSWNAVVVKGRGGLHIAQSPRLHGLSQSDIDKLRQVLTFVRTCYRWIVLDLGRLTTPSLSLLEKADEICLVSSTSMPSLFEVKEIVRSLVDAGFDHRRIRLVVNQMSDRAEFSTNDLERLFGVPVATEIPYAPTNFRDAIGGFCLPPQSSRFRRGITGLSRKLAGLPEEKRQSAVSRLASRALRFGT